MLGNLYITGVINFCGEERTLLCDARNLEGPYPGILTGTRSSSQPLRNNVSADIQAMTVDRRELLKVCIPDDISL